jgi:hypothetical protein
MAFTAEDVKDVFYNRAKEKCECCKKDIVFTNRDKGQKGAWHAHHKVPKRNRIDDSKNNMAILCVNDPENCHLNQGHGGSYQEAQPTSTWKCKS